MKLTFFTIALLFSQTNAFFSEIKNAMKETVGCTMFAVEKMLYMTGVMDSPRSVCWGSWGTVETSVELSTESYQAKQYIAQQIDSGVENTNRALFDMLDNNKLQEKLAYMENELHMDADKLDELRNLMSKSREEMSTQDKLDFLDRFAKMPREEEIYSKLDTLRDSEKEKTNSTEDKELSHLLDEIVDLVNRKNEHNNTDLVQNSNSTNKTINNDQISKWKQEKSTLDKEIQDRIDSDISESLKEIAVSLSEDIAANKPSNSQQKDTSPDDIKNKENSPPKYFGSFSDLLPKDKVAEAEVVNHAQKIVEENQYAEMVFSSIFNNSDAQDLFSNLDKF